MNDFLKATGELLPVIWTPLLAGAFLIISILAWCIPAWRGNALSAIPGFVFSLGGLWLGQWVSQIQPKWARWTLRQLEREAFHAAWIDLRPHMGRMFMTLVFGGLAYLGGLIVAKTLLRAWIRFRGPTISDATNSSCLSPFH